MRRTRTSRRNVYRSMGLKYIKSTESEEYRGTPIKILKTTFNKYNDPKDWKKGFIAVIQDKREADRLGDAIRFYHGATPEVTPIETMVYPHKDALVKVPMKVYRVSSLGYMG